MKIGSIQSPYGGLHSINSIPKIDEKQVINEQKPEASKTEAVQQDLDSNQNKSVKPVQLQDISLNFNKGETYDYIGKDSDINNLDVKKAVTDMRKDQLLEQYQFFVGTQSSDGIMLDNSDGLVIRK